MRIGEVCSLTVTLPPYQLIYVAAGIVRWVRGELGEDQEYGVESLVIDDESREEMEEYLVAVNEEGVELIGRARAETLRQVRLTV